MSLWRLGWNILYKHLVDGLKFILSKFQNVYYFNILLKSMRSEIEQVIYYLLQYPNATKDITQKDRKNLSLEKNYLFLISLVSLLTSINSFLLSVVMSSSLTSMLDESISNDDPDVYNIVLFGGTNSRFSQFISGFEIWLNYPKYDDAICAQEIKPLLPLRYVFVDSNFKDCTVNVDGIHKEINQDSRSTYQMWSTISIPTPFHNKDYPKDVFINFIVCPFEESKGEEIDKLTISQLKGHLSSYKSINAIIVLLNEDFSFISTWLKLFCSDLEQNALDNIIFVFSNNQSMKRKSVNKLQSCLINIDKDLSCVKIPFNPGLNDFWLENEAFETLFANRQGCSIDEDDVKRSVSSWENSVVDANRLLNYVVNLTSFKIKIKILPIEISSVKQVVNFLHKISHLIQDNLTKIRSYEDVLFNIPKDMAQVIKFPFPKKIGMRITKLKKSVGVCNHFNCTTNDKTIQRCSLIGYNRECELNSDNEKKYNETEELCETCGHQYRYHDIIYAKINQYEIDNGNTEEIAVEKMLSHLLVEKEKYKSERTTVVESIAKLVLYLKSAANISSNDTCVNHLLRLMMREEKDCNKEKSTNFETYKNFLLCYTAQKLVMEEKFKTSSKDLTLKQAKAISKADIERIMEDLFNLEFTGEYIKDFYLGINNHSEDGIQEQLDPITINNVESMLTAASAENKNQNDMVTYNILLIGETGTGKSTFINSLGNYLEFHTFEEAMNTKNDIKVLIPTRIQVNGNYITVGESEKNELNCVEMGSSDTQTCSVYSFVAEGINVTINFIDSPGIGDTRGVDQDDKNLDNIVETLGKFDYINAIVILLKPNDSRLSASFAYCLKGLLASLEKSAAQNIVFLFTNSRASFYQPGETSVLVKQVLADVKEKTKITIPFNSDNTFSFDNEAFKFLLESREGGTLNEHKIGCCRESWEKSSKISEKFLSYVSQLPEHNIKESVSLVRARIVCKNLIKPLNDISGFIEDNIKRNENLVKELLQNKDNITELSRLLNTKRFMLRITHLKNTAGVCNHKDCSTPVEDSNMVCYGEICHETCRVRGVIADEKENDLMRYCSNMMYKGEKRAQCNTCKHSYRFHMLIQYKLQREEIVEYKDALFDDLLDTMVTKKALKRKLDALLQETERYKSEQEMITKSLAKLAYYLKHSAIVPYNDAYEQYLRVQIENEKMSDGEKAAEKISRYESKLSSFQAEVQILEKEYNECESPFLQTSLKVEQVLDLINSLYKLENTGKYIEDMANAIREHAATDIEAKKVAVKQKGIMKYLHSAYLRSKKTVYKFFPFRNYSNDLLAYE